MAILVEDGTSVASAISYISAADATTYHAARGNALWTGTDAVKEAALIKAAMYLDGHYRMRWKGQKVYPLAQNMEWPRVGVRVVDTQLYYDVPPGFYDSQYSGFINITTIPQRLKDAQCELALLALSGALTANIDVSVKRLKVDVLEKEYFQGGAPGQTSYPGVDQLLSDYLKPEGSQDVQRG